MVPEVRNTGIRVALLFLALPLFATRTEAADQLCDSSFQDCRAPILNLIRNERKGLDVAFWFMEDARYAREIIARHNAGVPVRVLIDRTATSTYPGNGPVVQMLKDAGIPLRDCIMGAILHWKAMIFIGQNKVQFSGANYSAEAFAYGTPYVDYVDEASLITDDASIVGSFKTQFDSWWLDDKRFADYANVKRPLTRRYAIFAKDPRLNFVPLENFATRSVARYRAETLGIDAIIYRITDKRHSDEMIAAVKRGVPVRLITEPQQYRSTRYYWHSWNVDRMYMGGVKIRHRKHQGQTHQKTTLLRSQTMTIFGSSNWTSASASDQIEHNLFTNSSGIFFWFRDMFERKWFNETGNAETQPFVPLPPDKPVYVGPANGATGVPTTGVMLQWKPGYWAHKADIYFGTSSNPPRIVTDRTVSPNSTPSYTLPTLASRRTYYWKIVSKTMADKTATGAVRSFTTK